MLLPRARQPEFRLPCRGSAGIPPQCLRRGRRRCPVRVPEEIEGQEHGQALPAGSGDRLGTRPPRTPPNRPGSGPPLRPAACPPSRSPARPPLRPHPECRGTPGIFRQATELTKPQCDLFTALAIDPPKRIQELAATR